MKKGTVVNKKISILIVLVSLFMSVGYAAINSIAMDIDGTVAASVQNGIYITDVKYTSDVNADKENSKIIRAYQTMLNSNIVLSDVDANSSITYTVSIYNSTNETYYFDKVDYLIEDTTYSNQDIAFKITDLDYEKAIDSKKSLTFKITFYYKDNILADNNILVSYLNFSFKKMYNISYVNILDSDLPNGVLDGNSFVANLKSKAPNNIKVYLDNTIINDYTYNDYVLTIPNVVGNIKIVGEIGMPDFTSSNLVPILYDGENWLVTNTDDWCNYGKQEWCNAVLLKNSVSLNVGSIVDMDNDVRAAFVWIPRYEYKISTDEQMRY